MLYVVGMVLRGVVVHSAEIENPPNPKDMRRRRMVDRNPTKLQRICRKIPYKVGIWWFEFRGGLKKEKKI